MRSWGNAAEQYGIVEWAEAGWAGRDEKLARQAGMYLCHRYSGEKLRTIGELFNVRESAISEASRLFPRKMEKDKKLEKAIERIKGELNI